MEKKDTMSKGQREQSSDAGREAVQWVDGDGGGSGSQGHRMASVMSQSCWILKSKIGLLSLASYEWVLH